MSLVPPSHQEGLRNNADSYEKLEQRIKLRQDTPANWLKNDPVLESGEFGYEIGYPTGKLKIGTGSTRWSELPYLLARGQTGAPGQPGQPGPPGKGIQIKGVADVWPPPGTPETGDLWLLDDPLPPTAPAGSAPGDGYVWSGTKWVSTGPFRGPEGESVSVFKSVATPTAIRMGDLWIKPTSATEVELYVWDNTKWVLAASGGGTGTVSTTGNPIGLTESPALPLQTWAEEIHGAIDNRAELRTNVEFDKVNSFRLESQAEAIVRGPLIVFGTIYYGGTPLKDANGNDRADPGRYILPTPTGDGYLRSDLDPDTGWYFSEPVIVSDTEPPAPAGGGAIWVNPTEDSTPVTAPFSNLNPPVSLDPPIMETATSPLGIVNNTYIEPDVVGAVPIVVNGKRYLLPLLEAPASAALRAPLFEFADDPVHQQSDGSWIGFNDTGTNYVQPDTVAAIPILVGGKKYLLPLIEE